MSQVLSKINKTFLIKTLLVASMLLIGFTFFGVTPEASASVTGAMSKAGITAGSGSGDGFISEGKTWIYFLMAIGGLVIVGCLIIAAIKFAASSGNAQKRTEAMWWIAGCFVGIYIVYKAFNLAGWAVSLGS